MPDSTTIAIAGLAATTLTGIGAPLAAGWINAKAEMRRFRNERVARDFDELRELLDHGSEALWAYIDAVDTCESRYIFVAETDFGSYEKALVALTDRKAAAYKLHRQMVIRMGRAHSVSTAFANALEALDLAAADIGRLTTERTAGKEPEKDPARRREILARTDEKKDSRAALHGTFADAATDLVGAPSELLKR